MQYVQATRVVHAEGVENAETLLIEKPLQIGLAERNCAVLKGKASVILDFGSRCEDDFEIMKSNLEPNEL